MRKSYSTNWLRLLAMLALCSAGVIDAVVVWTTGSTPDVTDQDLELADNTIVLGAPAVSVVALTTDVNVNLTNPGPGGVTIEGQNAGNSRLYFTANAGRTITVNMTKDLTFLGSAGGAISDLLVVVRGLGEVVFKLDGNTVFRLAKNPTGGSVQMYTVMSQPLGTVVPTLLFQRRIAADPAPNQNVEVVVGEGSILSYLSTEAQPSSAQEAEIIFDTTNAVGSGRTVLTIEDTAAVIVRGRLFTNISPIFGINDISPAVPAGLLAKFTIENFSATTSGSLLVQNFNATIGEFIWDPWANLGVRTAPPYGTFSGTQYGFIVGSFGELNVATDSYLDYVGLSGTTCVSPAIPGVSPSLVSSMVKPRSGSALFTDAQPDDAYTAPHINIEATAGVYFRSGIGNDGTINPDFTVNASNRTPGEGIPVFDIEGVLNITGANTATVEESMFQLLSLQVAPTGGPLFANGTETIFPLRTFAKNSEINPCTDESTTTYVSYNSGAFLNNGRVNLFNVSWEHTDQNHLVIEKDDVLSEPAYVGGETWLIQNGMTPPFCMPRPKWAFVNSRFNIHTSVALTGVDLLVPNGTNVDTGDCIANDSYFVFYQNGYVIDNGTGRQMNLGTYLGSLACDGCTVISKDANLDVMQTQPCPGSAPIDTCPAGLSHQLFLETAPNTDKIVEGIPSPAAIANQFSIQTIYLGNGSNISIGTDGSVGSTMDPNISPQETFPLTTCPTLLICGNFFSFESRGGRSGIPAASNVTGQGGIFVDMNGTITICMDPCRFIANMGVMVTRSRNGIVNLPKSQVLFDPAVGIANWNLDMNDPEQIVIIPAGTSVSDYTINWRYVTKNYNVFTPYIIDCINTCSCPPVVAANVTDIPTIEGTVQQLQIEGTRLGDPAHIKIDGGIVEELVFIPGFKSASAAVAVVVLEDQATVGLGTAHRNIDSIFAEFTLGANGVNLIMNGSESTVVINEDMIINNVCSILPGPGITDQAATLRITSDCCNTLRVTKDGVLDLSMLETDQVIEFGGNLKVVFDPGSRVLFNNGFGIGVGPTLRWAEQATCTFSPLVNTSTAFTGNTLANTNPYRVILTGIGQLEFIDCSRGELFRDAFVGIESLPECDIPFASINLNIFDGAQFLIGDVDCQLEGGALQVGNVIDQITPSVSFALTLNGPNATFEIGPQGFFGTGVGVVAKEHTGHNLWRVAPTANLLKINFDLQNGVFRHPQVYPGSDLRSALFAISNSINGRASGGVGQVYNYTISPLFDGQPVYGTLLSNTSLLGGGNFISVYPAAGTFNPIVDAQTGPIPSANPLYLAGLLGSRPLIVQDSTFDDDAAVVHNFLKLQDIAVPLPSTNRGIAAPSYDRNEIRIAWIDNLGVLGNGQIGREDRNFVQGQGAQPTIQQSSINLGAVGLIPTPSGSAPRPIIRVASLGS